MLSSDAIATAQLVVVFYCIRDSELGLVQLLAGLTSINR